MKKIAVILTAYLLISPIAVSPSFSQQELSASGIFAKESDAVVLIGAFKTKKDARLGSGFIISPNGLIITNYHIIKDAKDIIVKLKDKKQLVANLLVFDETKDIAVIKIPALKLKTVAMGNSDLVKIGERVIAIGNPLGLESTISDGLISAVRTMDNGVKMFQTSVPLSSGSSGSPIFNYKGEVVGVTVSGRFDGQNLNFAIPINSVRKIAVESGYHEPSFQSGTVPVPDWKRVSGYVLYVVKQNDTLYSVSKKFNSTVDEIAMLNRLTGAGIYVGQKLKIPRR
jgi:S1-C subfamily serine protease